MSLEAFSRGKEEGCLSAWQVSQLALGLAPANIQAHSRSCELCAARVLAEEKARAAAVYERVPTVLWAWAGKPSLLVRARPFVVVGVATALIVLVGFGVRWAIVASRTEPLAIVRLSVSRGDQPVANEASADKVGKLEPGDKLRLRVQGPQARWARLQARQGKSWDVYFEGPIPEDGWLPAGLTVPPLGGTVMHLLTCPETPAPGNRDAVPPGCEERNINL